MFGDETFRSNSTPDKSDKQRVDKVSNRLKMCRTKSNPWKYLFWLLLLSVLLTLFIFAFIVTHYSVTFTTNLDLHDTKTSTNRDARYRKKRSTEDVDGVGGDGNDIDDKILKTNTKKPLREKNKKGGTILTEDERQEFHTLVADQLFAENIERNLIYLASNSHMAGTREGLEQAKWVEHKFRKYQLDNVIVKTYSVLLSYPEAPGNLTLFNTEGEEIEKISVIETKLDSFEKTTRNPVYPPFLAYTKSKTVEGEMVYANFGTEEDFIVLNDLNVDVKDKIVLIRYGMISRNKKIKFAEARKVKGIILFSDPVTYSPTGISYPDSWYLPPDGVQRGTLLRMRGDPLTRGYPAIKGLYQRPVEEVDYFPKVPVQPIGYGDARKLLRTMDGKSAPKKFWNGGMNITYNITSKDHRKVKVQVNVSREVRDIKNVIGCIKGELEPDRLVIVGNHRDAWTYGAADPSSGTAVMMEVARALGELKEKGWKPRRTIMLCSWDAEEYGLLGSTEWTEQYTMPVETLKRDLLRKVPTSIPAPFVTVCRESGKTNGAGIEENAKILSHQAVAYINVDTAVQGNHSIELKSTPELVDVFFDAVKKFKDPDSKENLYDVWVRKDKKDKRGRRKEPEMGMFREGSDYMPFYADLGIPSMDFRYMFNTKEMGVYNYPVYHTMHDNINWMRKYVDPDFRYHVTIGKIWTQVILLLADSTLLPFNFIRYSDSLFSRVKQMSQLSKKEKLDSKCNFTLLSKTVYELRTATRDFHNRLKDLDKGNPLAVRAANDQMMLFERTFVTSEDIPGEPLTRHVYHTAGLLKALHDVIANKNSEELQKEFMLKYSIYTYHVMMAIHALKNPFTSEGHVNNETELDPTEK